jgi:hypothetical protein
VGSADLRGIGPVAVARPAKPVTEPVTVAVPDSSHTSPASDVPYASEASDASDSSDASSGRDPGRGAAVRNGGEQKHPTPR